jgi:energy-coupling factor transport system ATP-binding protein
VRDVFAVWRNTRAIVLVALTAGVYAAVLIPFKAIPVVPGITEIRPANCIPPVCSLLFGPAAAWGCAIGNLIGDFFGSIGPGSLFGFIGNFLLGYLPYRLWLAVAPRWRARGSLAQLPLYALVTLVSGAACALVIGFGADWLGLVPYSFLFPFITFNNALMGVALGPALLALLYPRAARWGLLAEEVQDEEDLGNGWLAPLGALLVVAMCAAGWVLLRHPDLVSAWVRPMPLKPGASPPPFAFTPVRVGSGVLSLALLVGTAILARAPRLRRPSAHEAAVADGGDTGSALAVRDVSFRYRDAGRQALSGLSLAVEPGTFVALMGRTGAGKSTLCRCTNGLVPQFQAGEFSGRVSVFGREVSRLPVREQAEWVGLVFQDFDAQLIAAEATLEVAFALENLGLPRPEMEARVTETLQQVGLAGFEGRDPETLSGGEKQRLALASVLAARPRLLVLDEPTTDLDPQGKAEVFAIARHLTGQGLTVVMAEHEPDHAVAADRVVALAEGAVSYDGPPQGLLTDAERCLRLGIRPPEIPACFAAVGAPERPLTVEEGIEAGRRLGLRVDPGAREKLHAADAARRDRKGEPLIVARALTHAYSPGREAISEVDLTVHEGEFLAILGQNGSGKTTLAKHLNGLLRPTSGTITVAGGKRPADLARTVGYVFQDPDHQIFCATVREEVTFGPRNLGLDPATVAQRVAQALADVGLSDLADADPFALTKGERQATAVASALACDPRVLVLDEPTTGLDGAQQERMMGLLRQLNERGRTIIIITHSMWAAAGYAHRVVVMSRGRVIADGPAREVFDDHEALAQAALRPTATAELSQALFGVTFLSPGEFGEAVRPRINAEERG